MTQKKEMNEKPLGKEELENVNGGGKGKMGPKSKIKTNSGRPG